jgi:hypothetical protein
MKRALHINLTAARAGFASANRDAARIILASPDMYPPDGSLATWARAVLGRGYIPASDTKESEKKL